jgi:signal transduction histidine kinase
MNTSAQKFHKEIEIERLWTATNIGKSAFWNMLPFSLLIVFGLWEKSSHAQIVIWFLLFNALNIAKWIILGYYRKHKQVLADDVNRFKRIILVLGSLTGLAWVACAILFMNPSDPANVLIICIPCIVQAVGGMSTWFAYPPTVLVISSSSSFAIMGVLLAQGSLEYLVTALFIATLPVLSYLYTQNLYQIVNNSLRLGFENRELRRESEEKSILLETALENMGQGIAMSDKNDRLRMWNHQFSSLLGDAGSLAKVDANLQAILQAANLPIMSDNEDICEYRPTDEQAYEIRQTQLTGGGRVLTFTDITNLVKREQALEKARKEAEQANAAKTRFLAAASHDLRQPIHALGLFFAELSERVRSADTERVIHQIEDSIEAINSMLNALLDVSKLDAGVVKPEISQFALNTVLMRLDAEFLPIALQNQNRLKIRPTDAWVISDATMLERMLRNLIGNALRHTQEGRILIGARRRRDKIEIQVLDTGPGIPADQLDEIFVEFHQLNNPARDRRQGLGLGLAIVKRVAHLLGHELKVKSRLGKGSCFSLTLPLVSTSDVPVQTPAIETLFVSNFALAGYKLLIVDDDISVRESMHGLLTHWGFEVMMASTQQEAESYLSAYAGQIALMIVDYRLADNVSGIEVARQLTSQLKYPMGVLIITGDTGPERLREAEASGYPLLHKPVQPARLRSTLQFLIRKTRQQQFGVAH